MRTARLNQAGTRLRVIDEVGALQVESACAEVADFKRGLTAQLLLERGAPLLNVLRRRVQLQRGETHHRGAQYRRGKVQRRDAGNIRVALRGQRENIRHVVALVAPCIHVNRRIEDAVGHVGHHAKAGEVLSQTEARREVGVVGIHKALRIAVLSTDKYLRRSAAEVDVAVGVADVDQWTHEFVANAVGERSGGGQAPRVLREAVSIPLAQVHLGYAGLTLPRCGKSQQKAGQRGSGAVIQRVFGGEAVGEL